MTTMNAPMSFELSSPDAQSTTQSVASRPVSGPKAGTLFGVFLLSLVWSFFTLLGMTTAQMWAVDRFLIPQISQAYATELTTPMPVYIGSDETSEVVGMN